MQRMFQCLVISLLGVMMFVDFSQAANRNVNVTRIPWQTSGYQGTQSFWGEPPLSCVPYRAGKWESESDKPLCHCPPQSMCPSSVEDWNNNPIVPPFILTTCCDIACPRGTVAEITFIEKKVKTGEALRVAARMNEGIAARARDIAAGVNTRANQAQEAENEVTVIPGCDWPAACASVNPEGTIPPYCAGYWVSKHGEWIVNDDPNVISSACVARDECPSQWPKICGEDITSALELDSCQGYWAEQAGGALELSADAQAELDACAATDTAGNEDDGTPPNDDNGPGCAGNESCGHDDPVGCEGLDGCEVTVVNPQTVLVPQLTCTPIADDPCDKITTLTDPNRDPSLEAEVPSISCTVAEAFCVLKGTEIAMADGTTKKVEDIQLGDKLRSGSKNVVEVEAVSRVIRSKGQLHAINGGEAFITSEHPILTTKGWKAIAPSDKTHSIKIVGPLEIGDEIVTLNGVEVVKSIETKALDSADGVATFNMIVNGDGTFVADGKVVKSMKKSDIYY